MTEKNKRKPWVLYDGNCPVCTRWIDRVRGPLSRHGFELVPQQSDFGRDVLKLPPGETAAEVKVLTREGDIIGGADAMLIISRFVWWMRPLWWFSHVPGVMAMVRLVYRWIARNRYCFGGACRRNL